MRRLASLIAFTLAAGLCVLGPPTHADGSYVPSVPTSCHLQASLVGTQQRLTVDIKVTGQGNQPVTGLVRLALRRGQAGRLVWSRAVPYDGGWLRVTGPGLRFGRFVLGMRFSPDDSTHRPCRASARLALPGDRGGQEDHSALPDTGGPPFPTVLMGLALLLSGALLTRAGRAGRVA